MKFGFILPNSWGIEDAKGFLGLASRAEDLGFESVWASHHLFNAGYVATRLGNKPYYDTLTTLTHAAATTHTVRLGTSVMVLPYHHPVNLAKIVATLDAFSDGRVDLGIGAGALEEEFRGLGVSFAERGAYTDESIEVMKTLWTEDTPEFKGRYFQFSGMAFSPKPVQKPYPPIYVGGASLASVRRAARLGDWWHPNAMEPVLMRERIGYLKEQVRRFGRSPEEVGVSMRWDLDFPAISGVPPAPSYPRPCLIGAPEKIADRLRSYAQLGVQESLLATMSLDLEVVKATMDTFAREVMPAFQQ